MPTCLTDDEIQCAKSRLGKALVRLQRTRECSREQADQTEKQFRAWQAKWSSKRDQIARRLTLIDSELERLITRQSGAPQLSLIGTHI